MDVGTETLVNSTTADTQRNPSITGLDDGGYVVAWQSYLQDGEQWGIYTQQYNSSGIAVGSETLVNTTTASQQLHPSITGLDDGGYVVAWMSYNQDGDGYGIYTQQYNSSGIAVGSETLVNTTTASHQYYPSITGLDDGGYVVAWQSYLQDGEQWGIYTQQYASDGTTAAVFLESDGLETIHTGTLSLTTDQDTTEKHTFQIDPA